MKKLICCFIISCCVAPAYAEPPQDSNRADFPLKFTKEIQGSCNLGNDTIKADMGYDYDFYKNYGSASLYKLNDQDAPAVLNPLGIQDITAFMTDLSEPIVFKTPKEAYSVNLVFLQVNQDGTPPSAMMRLHSESHDCIVATENFVP